MRSRKIIAIDDEDYEVSDAFLSHVLQVAVEGGSSYWADVNAESTGDDASQNGILDFDVSDYAEDEDDAEVENDNDTESFYTSASFLVSKDPSQGGTLDLEDVADAIERIANKEAEVAPAIREMIIAAVQEGEETDIDSEAADCIVQIGLFDEIIYS